MKHVRNSLWRRHDGDVSCNTAPVRSKHTYEVVVHRVFDVVLRNGIFPVDDLQFGSILEWVLLKTQQVEDASEGLRGEKS